MSISMYLVTVPPIVSSLSNLRDLLGKALTYSEARKIDPSILLNTRLYPDMFPLVKQVQIATDIAKGGVSRLAGAQPPRYEDNETTFEELIARIDRTIDLLKSFDPDQINGSTRKIIDHPMRDKTISFEGLSYLVDFVLPNIYFHVTVTYAILRHSGVEIGKKDFLGDLY